MHSLTKPVNYTNTSQNGVMMDRLRILTFGPGFSRILEKIFAQLITLKPAQ